MCWLSTPRARHINLQHRKNRECSDVQRAILPEYRTIDTFRASLLIRRHRVAFPATRKAMSPCAQLQIIRVECWNYSSANHIFILRKLFIEMILLVLE